MFLSEHKCRKGTSIRNLWSADEARFVKEFINNLQVRIWNQPWTEVDTENATIFIPRGAGGVSGYRGPFRVWHDAENSEIVVDGGYRCVIDSNWQFLEEQRFPDTQDGVVFLTYTYSTVTPEGTIDVPGDWEDMELSDEVDMQDDKKRVVYIATVNSPTDIRQEHYGSIVVRDTVDCFGPEAES